jgi:hypothetical protein
MAVKYLEDGRYYIWNDKYFHPDNWNTSMELVRDGRPHKFIMTYRSTTTNLGCFDNDPHLPLKTTWGWGHVLKYFDMVPYQLEFNF